MSFASRRITTPAWAASLPTSLLVYDTAFYVSTASFSIGGSNSYSSSASTFAPTGTWLSVGSFSAYEVRLTLQSGTIGSGTLGSWLSLSSSNTWTNTADRGGSFSASQSGIALMEIRTATTQVVVASTQLTIDALSTQA
jgi:hypothetical protein